MNPTSERQSMTDTDMREWNRKGHSGFVLITALQKACNRIMLIYNLCGLL